LIQQLQAKSDHWSWLRKLWPFRAKKTEQASINDENLLAYEVVFEDGNKRVVYDCTYSRARVRAAWERLQAGAECHRQLHVVTGCRRNDLDRVPAVKDSFTIATTGGA
jgi:hypothetical protein